MHKLIFVNSNFSNVEFSDISSVPKTLIILFFKRRQQATALRGLIVALIFVGRGRRLRRPVYKNIILFYKDSRGRLSLQTREIIIAYSFVAGKLYLALHNKKETRGSLLSTGFYIAIELNKRSGILLWFTVAQTIVGNIGEVYVQTLDQPRRKVFCFFFSKKKRNS